MARPPIQYRIAAFLGRVAERLGAAWNWLISPFERLIGRTGEGAFNALDSFEGLESAVIGVLRVVFWPLIAVGRWIGGLLPEGGPGGGPVARASRAIGETLYALAERLNLDGVVRLLVWLLTPIWWPIGVVIGFANAWLATRQPRELALAAPALVAAVPFLVVAVQGAFFGKADVAEHYKVAVRDAVEAGDYRRVNLYERKLAQLGVDTRRRDYQTALTLADDEKLGSAYERMKRLAPVDSPGYPSAHVWIAQRLLSGELTSEQEPQLDELGGPTALAEQHLERLRDLEVSGVGVSQLRAYVFAQSDRLREAVDELTPYSDTNLDAAAMRMRLLTQLRERDPARDQAKRFLELIQRPRGRHALRAEDYQGWALAAELLLDPQQMEKALLGWRDADPSNDRPRELLAQYRREQTVRLLADRNASPAKAARILAEAVRLGSSQQWTMARATSLVGETSTNGRLASVWERLIAEPNLPDRLASALGTAAAGAGRINDARTFFERLIDRSVEDPITWNNYAWTLLQEPGPEPETALSMVQRALELRPGDHRFRETRGQVYIALERWDDAVADLEYALNGLPESPEVHGSLATAYDALAKPQLAEIHRRLANP